VPLVGARAVVVGRSNVVGKPAGLLLLAQHATVTLCHSRTEHLAAATREADVLIAAVGRAHLLGAAHVKPGAIVVDVGTNPTPGGDSTGDVDAEAVEEVVAALTPVPGGVGPVTTMLLLQNTVQAAGG
jgi:methylenetetrahydrofolate dehydrogenase (NADP+)/methenyltetrahydrofolate cyclohydrolase